MYNGAVKATGRSGDAVGRPSWGRPAMRHELRAQALTTFESTARATLTVHVILMNIIVQSEEVRPNRPDSEQRGKNALGAHWLPTDLATEPCYGRRLLRR